jgi:hypothetical protein
MVGRGIDARSLAEALAFPGIDPRTWISIATVDPDEVTWDEDLGYLVPVTLQPTQVQGVAVCAQDVAGNSEGSASPFVEGDTLVVGVCHGMERAGVIVLGRLSNNRAPPPQTVAGQDSTANNTSWRKQRAPRLEEYGDRWTIRQASSEALLNVDAAGTWTVRDGGKGVLQLSSDVFSYQSGDSTMVLQFDLAASRFSLQCGEAMLAISSLESVADLPMSTSSVFSVPGSLQLSAFGNLAGEHAASVEGTANFLFQVLTLYNAAVASALASLLGVLGAAVTASPGSPLIPAAALTPVAAQFAALAGSLSGFVAGGATAGAATPQNPAIAAAVYAAMLAQPPKQVPAVPPQGQVQPGLGSAGILIG